MMLIIRLLAGSLVWIVAFLHPVITHAAGTLNYDPSGAACNTTYKSMSVAQDKAVTLTCPAAPSNAKPFHIEYRAGLAGCSAYTTIENNTANNTLTINCATAAQLFKIENPPSTAQNAVVTFNVSRLIDKVGNDTLTLSILDTLGHFTTDASGLTPLSTPTQATVTFDGNSPNTQLIYAKITTPSGSGTISARGNSGTVTSPVISVAAGCGETPSTTSVVNVGELVSLEGTNQLSPPNTSDARWSIRAKATLAIKFTLNAEEPVNKKYVFKTYDSVPLANWVKKFSLSRCPGIFNNLPPNCYLEQTNGMSEFPLLTPSYKGKLVGCHLDSLNGTYYWNIQTIDQTLDNVFIVNVNE
jgi:hypothetical protein